MPEPLPKELPRPDKDESGIIGESVAIRKIVDVIAQVAPTDITILITGESGVGKEVIAKAIHVASKRSKRPLIAVNCGAIPEGLIESELFGHEKGSFTGAVDQRKGYFELADGGTIFLDEIGELPLSAQVKFLRVLENGEFQRVGSSLPRTVNVRVIAATNKDLEHEVRNGTFRADLFFRLRSVNIVIPPLRERPEDVPVFFQKFAAETAEKNRIRFGGISPAAMELLQSYHWPGNVRELRNVVDSMLVLEQGKYLEADTVRKYLKEYKTANDSRSLPVPIPGRSVEQAERELIFRALLDIKTNIIELKQLLAEQQRQQPQPFEKDPNTASAVQTLSLQDMEQRMISEALERYKGNRRVAARALNISERTLYRKIKEYGIG